MTDHYIITGPALISFSGGRTSGYMLHQIVQAHDGKLPDDVVVAFANTGKEREETLRFVHECGSRWGVDINWLEWRDGKPEFERVGFNSASRQGEPFQALIDKKKRLPNWQERWCTQFLKVKVQIALAASLGWKGKDYANIIGLRYDEGLRIFKGLDNAEKNGISVAYPLSKARVTKADVMAFWASQPFNLGLESWEGNCDMCFLKGRGIRKRIIRDNPRRADWWASNESSGGWFDKDNRYAGLIDEVRKSPTLFDEPEDEEYDVECGLHCAPSEPA